ncbi:MAG: PIN domain-containing protein [Nanoarchaeota archaeon]|nr:PIN domain-containing protein [Nanoarchaeota archaeon]MBU0978008.1 PIN domain-containing protein [Nanoarchaeota archaeon]
MKYFFDSYAIIEIIKTNPNYDKFIDQPIVTNALNLAEVHYHLLNTTDKQSTENLIENLEMQFIEITPSLALKAAEFRHAHKKAKVSYADCIGYISAKQNSLLFLTGDKEFESFDNVEFAK